MIAQTSTLPVVQWERLHLYYWADQVQNFPLAAVVLIVAAGIIFLLYGRSLFRAIIIINAMLLAGYVGWQVGLETRYPWLFALGLAAIFGILAWPLFKLGFALLAGLAGAAAGMHLAAVFPHGDQYAPVYAIVGFILFAILGWLILMAAVTVFTAFEGATMIVLALLDLLRRAGVRIQELPWLSPGRLGAVQIAIWLLAILGILYQFGLAARAEKAIGVPPASK